MHDTEPKFDFELLGPFDVLTIWWPGAEIETVMLDDELRTRPDAGSTAPGEKSLWQLPHYPLGELYITAKGPGGEKFDHPVNRDPLAEGKFNFYVQMTLWSQPSGGGIQAWGIYVQPILELVSATDERTSGALPKELLSMRLKVQRRNRRTAIRPLHVMDPFVTSTISLLYDLTHKAELDWQQRMGSGEIPKKELYDVLTGEDAGLSFLSEAGRECLLDALKHVRTDGWRYLEAIRLAHGEQQGNFATGIWKDAAPALVGMKLTPQQIGEAGLAPTTSQLRLTPLIVCDGDTLSISDVPECVAVDVALPDGSLRPARWAKAEIADGRIVWSEQEEKVAKSHFAQRAAALARTWVTRAAQSLRDSNLTMGAGFHEDAEKLEVIPDAPEWLAEAAYPARGAFEKVRVNAGLRAPHFWTQLGLPKEIVRRTLVYLVQIGMPEFKGGGSPELPRVLDINPGETAYSTLLRIDGALSSSDKRYDRSVREAARENYINTADTHEGRCAALLLSAGSVGTEVEAFLDALHEGDEDKAIEIVRQRLRLSGAPTLVAP